MGNTFKLPVVDATLAVSNVSEDLKLILKQGITKTELAQQLGVSRITIFNWLKGRCHPEQPFQIMTIYLCAKRIREQSGKSMVTPMILILIATSCLMLAQSVIL